MSIRVHNPLLYHYTNNQRIIEVNGETVGECVKRLIGKFPEMEKVLLDKSGNVQPYVDIYVNGASAYPKELAKPVKDGDEIHLLFTIGGG